MSLATTSKLILALILLMSSVTSYGKFSEWKDCSEVSAHLPESERGAFYERLRTALLSRDTAALSKMIKYPLNLFLESKKQTIKDEKAFQNVAEAVFTKDFVSKLLNEEPGSDVCNDQGLGISHGSVWVRASEYGKKPEILKIVTINK